MATDITTITATGQNNDGLKLGLMSLICVKSSLHLTLLGLLLLLLEPFDTLLALATMLLTDLLMGMLTQTTCFLCCSVSIISHVVSLMMFAVLLPGCYSPC